MSVYFVAIWNISWPFGKVLNDHLVNFVVIGYIFTVLVCCTEKNLATLAAARFETGTTVEAQQKRRKIIFFRFSDFKETCNS
jgi:hypothetical protein